MSTLLVGSPRTSRPPRREPDPPAFWIVFGAVAWVSAMVLMAASAR